MRRVIVLLFVIVGLVSPAMAERVALVVGNSTYEHVPSLANPHRDARAVAGALEDLGFTVSQVLDADYGGLRRALRSFKDEAARADVALIYYAGHGIEIGHENFLIPSDAELRSDTDVEFEAVPMARALQAVGGARELSLLIVDACRDNPFLDNMSFQNGSRSIGRGLSKIEPSGNTLVAYAAKGGTIALDGKGENSPYAQALLEHLPTEGIEIGIMFRRVRDRVIELTGGVQEPFLYGSLSAEPFYFSPPRTKGEDTVLAPRKPGGVSEDQLDLVFWQSIQASSEAADFEAYLARFPSGVYAALAQNRIAAIQNGASAAKPSSKPGTETDPSPATIEDALGYTVEDWQILQEALSILGFERIVIDGVPGPSTRAAIQMWQDDTGKVPTGYLTRIQAELLYAQVERKLAALRAEEERKARRDEISGVWSGVVQYTNVDAPPFTFSVTLTKAGASFSGRMSEPNTFGDTDADELFSNIWGAVGVDRSVNFTKTYEGTGGQTHSVQYYGSLDAAGQISGTWEVSGATGTFSMQRK